MHAKVHDVRSAACNLLPRRLSKRHPFLQGKRKEAANRPSARKCGRPSQWGVALAHQLVSVRDGDPKILSFVHAQGFQHARQHFFSACTTLHGNSGMKRILLSSRPPPTSKSTFRMFPSSSWTWYDLSAELRRKKRNISANAGGIDRSRTGQGKLSSLLATESITGLRYCSKYTN